MAGFLRAQAREVLGSEPEVYVVAARRALAAHTRGAPVGDDALGWVDLVDALDRFVHGELSAARAAAARAELHRIARDLRDAVLVETAAADLEVATSIDRVDRLRAAAAEAERSFGDDALLLAHEVDDLVREARAALDSFAATVPAGARDVLARTAADRPIGQLDESLRAQVDDLVRERFESFRRSQAARTESAWKELAERFRSRTEVRVNTVRALASDLLAIDLPEVAIPAMREERERFSYLFVHVGSTAECYGRMARRLLPRGVVLRRALARAERHLAEELDKHAGRATWDLAQRLDAVRRRFERGMQVQLEQEMSALLEAPRRAEARRSAAAEDREQRRTSDARALEVVDRILAKLSVTE